MQVKKLPSRSQTTSFFAQNNRCANAETPESRKTYNKQDQLPLEQEAAQRAIKAAKRTSGQRQDKGGGVAVEPLAEHK